MKYINYITLATALFIFSSCNSFKKEKDGLFYKIISDGKGKKLEPGKFFELKYDQTYKDSKTDTILSTSEKFGNQFAILDSLNIPIAYFNIFSKARVGDSIVVKQPTDSLLKGNPTQFPPFIKKGQFIIAHYKIVNVFDTKEQADSAFKIRMEAMRLKDSVAAIKQIVADDKTIVDFLEKNKITATKAAQGTYVEIITPGTGSNLDTSSVAKVNYTGRGFTSGKVFDSNVDPKFGHPEPFLVEMNAPVGSPKSVIKGWTDGLSLLNKGAKAKFYIPSSLGYGSRGAGDDIKPNEILIFEIEVLDILNKAQAKAAEEAAMKKMEAMQKMYSDSMQNSKK
jgi:FKBP-type peptidyl-prolyl cis-trans isomerase FkpA